MIIVRTVADVRRALAVSRQRTIGLVPTMGALHRGHVSLFHQARRRADVVVATIFVNPAQFGDPTDLAAYPRDEAGDAAAAEAAGIDVLFVPTADSVYPAGYATWIEPSGAALGLEGEFRPGHFRGVATVCLKLFTMVQPSLAWFGQKDAQQVAVIAQLVRDLNLPIELVVAPTERDVDGLALSSRNARLSADDRRRARAIPRALAAGLDLFRQGASADAIERHALAQLQGLEVDYARIADFGEPTLAIAARAGRTRLIDNMPLATPARGGEVQLRSGLSTEMA